MTSNKLLEHFKRMQSDCVEYLQPWEHSGYHNADQQKDHFVARMVEALDGPEQREAQAEAETVGNYIEQALRTESDAEPISDHAWLTDANPSRLLHAAMGLTTEAGEFLDALKKHLFYGKPLDLVNLKEELGDLMWYMAIACDTLGTDFEAEQRRNIAKLKARYPEKFTSDKAIGRDLDAEREVLEGSKVCSDCGKPVGKPHGFNCSKKNFVDGMIVLETQAN